jgi:hypothetical protein
MLINLSNAALRLGLAAALACGAAPAWAHHTFSIFDLSKVVSDHGVVKDFQWSNPHSWIDVEVKDASGATKTLALEGYSPNMLRRKGWTKDTIKPGDQIGFTYFPLRNGTPGGGFRTVTLANGKLMESYDFPASAAGNEDGGK